MWEMKNKNCFVLHFMSVILALVSWMMWICDAQYVLCDKHAGASKLN